MSSNRNQTVDPALVELHDVTKVYPNGTIAMRGVNLRIQIHSVHGLVGANGAGKSTLIKILSGALQATSGQMIWKGNACQWHQPVDARAAGVATMYQHIPLVPTLSVLDNVFLMQDPQTLQYPQTDLRNREMPVSPAARDKHNMGRLKRSIDYALRCRNWLRLEGQLMEEFEQLLARVGYEIDARSLVGDLSIGQRQMVALLQAVARGADLVIMDEPTASLTQSEREVVFNTIRRLSHVEGTSFLYVSHFLEEVLDLTDTVTVLRDGQVVASAATSDWSESQLVEAMVGKKLLNIEREKSAGISAAVPIALEVRDLQSPDKIAGISFAVHQGEILGLAGFLGSGRSELLQAIFGADPRASGSIRVFGKEVPRTPAAAVRAGIALVPEDRGKQGLIRDWEIWRNISLPDLSKLSLFKILPQQEAETARAEKACEALHIVTPSIDTEVSTLSGGNAQKVVFAKWLYGNASIFLLDEPTSGVDIGAKADILELIRNFAREGKAVIVVSSEFEELLAVATRILVMSKGRVVAERAVMDTSEDELVMLASGLG